MTTSTARKLNTMACPEATAVPTSKRPAPKLVAENAAPAPLGKPKPSLGLVIAHAMIDANLTLMKETLAAQQMAQRAAIAILTGAPWAKSQIR